jgi:hypothetical protein
LADEGPDAVVEHLLDDLGVARSGPVQGIGVPDEDERTFIRRRPGSLSGARAPASGAADATLKSFRVIVRCLMVTFLL